MYTKKKVILHIMPRKEKRKKLLVWAAIILYFQKPLFSLATIISKALFTKTNSVSKFKI